jgi:hypothetical protein
MSGESQLLLMIAGVHFLGLACVAALLIPALRGGPSDGPPPDQGSDDGRGNDRRPPGGPGERPRGGIPLPDAMPARVRLRDHGRLADLLPAPERRPAREPERPPVRTGPDSPRRS